VRALNGIRESQHIRDPVAIPSGEDYLYQ
jgi:hypothetical protein